METEQQETTFMQIAIKYGLILGMSGVTLSLISFITNSQFSLSWLWSTLNYVVILACVIMAMKARKLEVNKGLLTYGQALGIGTVVALFGGILVALYQLVYQKYIDPEFFDKILAEAKRSLIEKNYSEQQLETSMMMMEKMKSPAYMFFTSLLGLTFMGFLFSLIAAIFMKKQDNIQYTE